MSELNSWYRMIREKGNCIKCASSDIERCYVGNEDDEYYYAFRATCKDCGYRIEERLSSSSRHFGSKTDSRCIEQ